MASTHDKVQHPRDFSILMGENSTHLQQQIEGIELAVGVAQQEAPTSENESWSFSPVENSIELKENNLISGENITIKEQGDASHFANEADTQQEVSDVISAVSFDATDATTDDDDDKLSTDVELAEYSRVASPEGDTTPAPSRRRRRRTNLSRLRKWSSAALSIVSFIATLALLAYGIVPLIVYPLDKTSSAFYALLLYRVFHILLAIPAIITAGASFIRCLAKKATLKRVTQYLTLAGVLFVVFCLTILELVYYYIIKIEIPERYYPYTFLALPLFFCCISNQVCWMNPFCLACATLEDGVEDVRRRRLQEE